MKMNPNLKTESTAGITYKDILLGKLSRAVFYSILSQLAILIIYVFIANINIFHPIQWTKSALNTFTYISTWVFVIIFMTIIFLQCIICAKDYVFMSKYCSTRFQQFLYIFSAHNFILLMLHSLIGGILVWQILSIVDGEYRYLIIRKDDHYHLVIDSFYLIVSGFWTGFYFFLRVYVTTKNLVFPVIQQKKFLHFRSNIARITRDSFTQSLWPTLYFTVIYYIWGNQFENRISSLFGLEKYTGQSSFVIYVYSWWFASLYFFSMNLMSFLFYLFLTESVQFPLIKYENNMLTLQNAMIMNNIPIIQHLACLDLFLLSQWSMERRQFFFALSQPGGHPHTWNTLVESSLKVFTEYTDLLKKSMEIPVVAPEKPVPKEVTNLATSPLRTASYSPKGLQSPLGMQSPIGATTKYRNMRNMSLYEDPDEIIETTHNLPPSINFDALRINLQEKFDKLLSYAKIILGINYFFGELPEVNIQKCLGNGHLIIWSSQGLAELMAASLSEDRYGVVQKDLPVVISTLVQLKQQFDKLNKVPSLSRKIASLDDFNYRMKTAVSLAVKRSLINICIHFGKYLNEFPLSKDVAMYLQNNIMLRNSR